MKNYLITLYSIAGISCLLSLLPTKVINKINSTLNTKLNENYFLEVGFGLYIITITIELIWRNI